MAVRRFGSLERRVRKYHRKGLIDREAAKLLGVHPSTVARVRTRLDLPPNGLNRGRHRKIDPARAMKLYQHGCRDPLHRSNDRTIAEELGVGRRAVAAWRHRNHLPAIGKRGPRFREPREVEAGEIITIAVVPTCSHCGYTWAYRGAQRKNIKCPDCGKAIENRIQSRLRHLNLFYEP